MNAKVYSNTLLIGYADLQIGDKSMGCVYGEFVPNENYYKNIQPRVWEFWQSNKADYKKWDLLRLNVQLENGCFLHPAGGYTIDDTQEMQGEPKRIDAAGISNEIIAVHFQANPPKLFVEKPWAAITIEQKIYFEDELQKEITSNSTSFNLDNRKHALVGYECSAICNSLGADDILFSIHKQGEPLNNYALVHLTYKKESDPRWPASTFFENFDDFTIKKMYPDKIDWEE